MNSERSVFRSFRDGEEVEYWDPVVSNVQGSLAEERRKSTGRFGKDKKEFKLVNRLNRQFRISLYEVFRTKTHEELVVDENQGSQSLEFRLSHLGARYPHLPGLGIYIRGLGELQGKKEQKKIFDLLFWISSNSDIESYWKYLILEPIGKMILNRIGEGVWLQNSIKLFHCLGLNSLAYEIGKDFLSGNPSAIRDSLENGKRLASSIFIEFYRNTRMYDPKNRKRGYSGSSPVRPNNSKKLVFQVNHSTQCLVEEGILKHSPEGGYEMEDKQDVSEIIFEIFKNSLEAFKQYQDEIEARKERISPQTFKPPEDLKEETSEEQKFNNPKGGEDSL